MVGLAIPTVTITGCLSANDDVPDSAHDIEVGESILFEGHQRHWLGLEPAPIEGEKNPALVLEEGETYEIGWVQGDGAPHNIELWDEDERVVNEYRTPLTASPRSDGDWLEFTARDELAYYRCSPHRDMQGEIYVRS